VIFWLKEVVFKMRRQPTKAELKAAQKEDVEWGRSRGLSEADLHAMLVEDRVDIERDSVEEPDAVASEGTLFKASTIYDSYLSALSELHEYQYTMELTREAKFRGVVLKQLMDMRRSQQDQHSRAAFEDRGAGGLNGGYSDSEFLALQAQLLRGSAGRLSVRTIPCCCKMREAACMLTFWIFRACARA
jgi:hypothetical protein